MHLDRVHWVTSCAVVYLLLQAGPSDAAAAAEGVLVDEQTNLLSSAQQQEANLLDLDDDSVPSTSGESHVIRGGG